VTGRTVKELKGHTQPVLSVLFSRDSKLVVTASLDHTARIWGISDNIALELAAAKLTLDDVVSATVYVTDVDDFPAVTKSFLPAMPKSRPRYGEVITQKNRRVAKKKPWTKGLYEGVIAADLIAKQKLEQRNRIALIVLDSTLEIAFKEYLVNESGASYSDAKLLSLFASRASVHSEIKQYVTIKPDTWKKIDHYYRIRCKLVHERVTAGIDDDQVRDYRQIVEEVLNKLYKLKFQKE